MTVIAMSRELGSRGKVVAAGLAERLGLEVVHHELVEKSLASRLGVPESEVHRYLEGTASLLERWKIDRKRAWRYTALELLAIAARGNVLIRGWGGACLLRDLPHVLRVRICAPMDYRVRVLMERLLIKDEAQAREEIHRNDASHAGTVQRFFGGNWDQSDLYHIVLNTGLLSIETCVDQVCRLAARPEFVESAATLSIAQDKLIEEQVRAEITEHFSRRPNPPVVTATVTAGSIILSGVTYGHSMADEIESRVRHILGVKSVENRLSRADGAGYWVQ